MKISSSEKTYDHHFNLAVKYVRREIRSLTSSDKENFLSALKIIYSLDKKKGIELYGEKFRSSEELLVKHLNGAATSDCDHWHDGAAILTHHVAFTLEIEQALQAINPSIAIPYWEYGMDAFLYSSYAMSPIFQSDWMGQASSGDPYHTINDNSYWGSVEFPSGVPYVEWFLLIIYFIIIILVY